MQCLMLWTKNNSNQRGKRERVDDGSVVLWWTLKCGYKVYGQLNVVMNLLYRIKKLTLRNFNTRNVDMRIESWWSKFCGCVFMDKGFLCLKFLYNQIEGQVCNGLVLCILQATYESMWNTLIQGHLKTFVIRLMDAWFLDYGLWTNVWWTGLSWPCPQCSREIRKLIIFGIEKFNLFLLSTFTKI